MTTKEKKQLKIGAIALAVAVALYFVLANKKEGGGAVDSNGNYIDPTGNAGVIPGGISNLPFSATGVAKSLYDAMKETGTSDSDIMPLLQNLSVSQFAQVITAFGRKSYNAQLGNQYNFNPFFSLPLEGLAFWLKSELSTDAYKTLKKKYVNYL